MDWSKFDSRLRNSFGKLGMPGWFKAVLIIFGLITLGSGIATCAMHTSRMTYTVYVTGTERVTSGNKDSVSSKYIVFTKDAEGGTERAFENTDSVLECLFSRCKFDSSDIQAKLKSAESGKRKVRITAYGWRFPLISAYQNIVDVKETN